MQSDPIGLDGGANTYSYVLGRPLQLIDPFGLLDINLHTPGTPEYRYAEMIPSTPDTISVGGHGNEWWPVDANGEGITAGSMADLINEYRKKKPKAKRVRFYVCDLGAGTYQGDVSNGPNGTGMESEAPDTHLWTYSNGATPKIYYPRVDKPKLPDTKRPGTWVINIPHE